MPLADFLYAMQNPEAYITNRLRHGEDADKQELMRNIYGAGYMGARVNGVNQDRGTLGSILQGIGLLDQPSPRSLTPFEQMMYEEGKHYRSKEDNMTDEQRQTLLHERLNLAQDVGSMGEMPPEEFMQGLPPDLRQNFETYESDLRTDKTNKQKYNVLQMKNIESEIAARKLQGDYFAQQKADQEFQQHQNIINQAASNPLNLALQKQYQILMNEATTPGITDDERHEALQQATTIYEQLKQKIIAASHGEATAEDILGRFGPSPDLMATFNKANPNRIISSPEAVDSFLGQNYPSPRMDQMMNRRPMETPIPVPPPRR
jgi:hypothetical protein